MPTSSYPPGKTFFTTTKRSYTDVPVYPDNENAVSTSEFLEATESLVELLNLLGSGFSLVTSDMTNNIKKVRARQLEKPGDSETLQDLVKNELKDNKSTATEGLLWLVRGLEFASASMKKNLENPKQELKIGFQEGYAATLHKHHNMAVRLATNALLASSVPYRNDFEAKLGSDPTAVETDMKPWVEAFEKIVAILATLMASPMVQNVLNPPAKAKKFGLW